MDNYLKSLVWLSYQSALLVQGKICRHWRAIRQACPRWQQYRKIILYVLSHHPRIVYLCSYVKHVVVSVMDQLISKVHQDDCLTLFFNSSEKLVFFHVTMIAKDISRWMSFKRSDDSKYPLWIIVNLYLQISLVKKLRMERRIYSSREIIESELKAAKV